jgi:hypothetical protein
VSVGRFDQLAADPREPISPELVLVSPALAERARAELPPVVLYEPARLRKVVSEARPQRHSPAPVRSARARLWRYAAAAAAVLIAGVAAGSYATTNRRPAGTSEPRSALAIPRHPDAGSRTALSRIQLGAPRRVTTPSVAGRSLIPATHLPVPTVLGVMTTAGDGFVRLQWQRPRGVARVAVFRIDGRRRLRRYEGRRNSFLDRSVRNGSTYRYVLLSYDRAGRSSSGVITVIRPSSS